MSRNMKAIFGDFVAMGTPTTTLDWRPFTADNNIFYELENGITGMQFFYLLHTEAFTKTLIFLFMGVLAIFSTGTYAGIGMVCRV